MTEKHKGNTPETAVEEPEVSEDLDASIEDTSTVEAADEASQSESIEELQRKLEDTMALLEEHKDQYLRAKADVENVRRRASNDVSNAHKYAIDRFATEMLAVKDSLDLAREVELGGDNNPVVHKMLEGLDLTLKQMRSVFEKFSIEEVAPEKGERFDPERHQAITTQESDEMDPQCIVASIQKGYVLHNRLLRPAMVIVSRLPSAANDETP